MNGRTRALRRIGHSRCNINSLNPLRTFPGASSSKASSSLYQRNQFSRVASSSDFIRNPCSVLVLHFTGKRADDAGQLTITLEPATKVIGKMRELFPKSILVGWKYELVGTQNDALAKASRQMEDNRTDACLLNGRAFGPGFAFCRQGDPPREFGDKPGLVDFLAPLAGRDASRRSRVESYSPARSRRSLTSVPIFSDFQKLNSDSFPR